MRHAQTLELPGLTLLRPVGSGSFGEVWLARSVTGQFRAVKIVWLRRPTESGVNTELEELGDRVFRGVQEYLKRIPPGSPAGLAVLHVDRDPDGRYFYYVMELADDAITGRDFDPANYIPLTLSELRRRSPGAHVPAPETLRLGIKLAEGLATLHRAGLVHRDLKPNNIVFIGGEPRLADIDLVRPSEASMSLGGAIGYAPPEGPGRPSGDVFGLARTLYVTTTGLPAGDFPRLPEDWDRRPDANALRLLNAVLLRACERDPGQRPADGSALRDEFLRVAAGEDMERTRRLRRLARITTIVAAITVPIAIIAVTVAWQFRIKDAATQFALYQANLADAASNLERTRFGNARRAIETAANYKDAGFEVELLRRQASGDLALLSTNIGNGIQIDRMLFSDDGSRIALATSSNSSEKKDSFRILETKTLKTLSVIHQASVLAGFIEPGHRLVGTWKPEESSRPLQVWDSDTGTPLPPRLPGKWIPAGIQRHDGLVIALNRNNLGEVVLWNPDSGKTIRQLWHSALPHDPDPGPKAALSDSGGIMMLRQNLGLEETYASQLFPTRIALLSSPPAFTLPSLNIRSIALSPNGQRAAFADSSIGQLSVGSTLPTFQTTATNSQATVNAIAFSPSGDEIATGGIDEIVRIQDSGTLQTRISFKGHGVPVSAIAWSRNGLLGSADTQGGLRLWNSGHVPANSIRSGFKIGTGPSQLIANRDESLIAVSASTNSIAILESSTFRQKALLYGAFLPLVFTAQSEELWAMASGGTLLRIRIADGKIQASTPGLPKSEAGASAVASPDGRHILVFNGTNVARWTIESNALQSHPISTKPKAELIDAAFNSTSDRVVAVGGGGTALVIHLATGAEVQIHTTDENFLSACFIPNSSYCLLGSEQGTLIKVNLENPNQVERITGDLSSSIQLLASPDGSRVFTGGPRGQLSVLRAKDGARLVWLTHLELAQDPKEHLFKRMLYLSKARQILCITEDGLLVRW